MSIALDISTTCFLVRTYLLYSISIEYLARMLSTPSGGVSRLLFVDYYTL